MKTKKIITASLVGILALSSAGTMLAFGGGNGGGNGNGGGCKGDIVCMKERQATGGQKKGKNMQSNSKEGMKKHGEGKNMQSNSKECMKKHGDNDEKLNELKNSPLQEMSEADKENISHMREEEKIARDVYITLYQKWGVKSFDNISKSEEKHMDAVKILIDKYGLEDSMKSGEVGVFNNPEFQKLYDDLIEKGFKSKADAIQVGMTIEDLDIYDLEKFMKETSNEDILRVFDNLNKGSMNHMRAFDKQLKKEGSTYKAQFITEERMNDILNGSDDRHEDKGEKKWGNKENGKSDGMGSHGEGKNEVGERASSQGGFWAAVWNFFNFWK